MNLELWTHIWIFLMHTLTPIFLWFGWFIDVTGWEDPPYDGLIDRAVWSAERVQCISNALVLICAGK